MHLMIKHRSEAPSTSPRSVPLFEHGLIIHRLRCRLPRFQAQLESLFRSRSQLEIRDSVQESIRGSPECRDYESVMQFSLYTSCCAGSEETRTRQSNHSLQQYLELNWNSLPASTCEATVQLEVAVLCCFVHRIRRTSFRPIPM